LNTGAFYMYEGAYIEGNLGGLGGGLVNTTILGPAGTAYMFGGRIRNNIGDGSGGGVVNNGYFFMFDGEIYGNTARVGLGGGVYNGNPTDEDFGTFVMLGGIIEGSYNGGAGGTVVPLERRNRDNANASPAGGMGSAAHLIGGRFLLGRLGSWNLQEDGNHTFTPRELRLNPLGVREIENTGIRIVDTGHEQYDPYSLPFVMDVSVGAPAQGTDEIWRLYEGLVIEGVSLHPPQVTHTTITSISTTNRSIMVPPFSPPSPSPSADYRTGFLFNPPMPVFDSDAEPPATNTRPVWDWRP
jgi:hypothetical protein